MKIYTILTKEPIQIPADEVRHNNENGRTEALNYVQHINPAPFVEKQVTSSFEGILDFYINAGGVQ